MDKKEALKILIEHSFFLSDEEKTDFLNKLPSMTDQQIENLGQLLALEKKQSIEEAPDKIKALDKVIEILTKIEDSKPTS